MNVRTGSLGRARAFVVQFFVLCLLCSPLVPAQDSAATQDGVKAEGGGAHKWDEFGLIGHCDMGARLDNLANVLQEYPQFTAYVVGYDPAKGSPGIAKHSVEMQRQYLINTRGIAAERVFALAAGRYEGTELKSELWIVPPGAPPPVEAKPEEAEQEFHGIFASFEMHDDSSFHHSEEMPGPVSMSVRRGAFADALKRQSDSKAYLVAYADAGRAPGAWRRFATSEKVLLEELGVEPSRLAIVNGGRRKESEVELWIVPKDAPPPVKAKREKRLREAAMIGTYRRFHWGDDEGDAGEYRWLLDNFAQMLREDPERVGCLVIFQDDEGPEVDEQTGEVRMPFDYVALAGRWRRELWERYRIDEHRIALLIGAAGEHDGSSLETWIVPKGVALPDPAGIVKRREAEMYVSDDAEGAEKP